MHRSSSGPRRSYFLSPEQGAMEHITVEQPPAPAQVPLLVHPFCAARTRFVMNGRARSSEQHRATTLQ